MKKHKQFWMLLLIFGFLFIIKTNVKAENPGDKVDVTLYNRILQAMSNFDREIDVSDIPKDIYFLDIADYTFEKVLEDYPEYQSAFSNINIFHASVGRITFDYSYDKSTCIKRRDNMRREIDKALSKIDSSMSQFEKESILHNYIIYNTDRITGTNDPYNYEIRFPYSALVDKKATDQGYAAAFKVLLNQAGIECGIIDSETIWRYWNYVKIDGKYYHVDIYRDDDFYSNTARIGRVQFLNMTDDEMKNRGFEWVYSDPMYPKCTDQRFSYLRDSKFMGTGYLFGTKFYKIYSEGYITEFDLVRNGLRQIIGDRTGDFEIYNNIFIYSNQSDNGYIYATDVYGSFKKRIKMDKTCDLRLDGDYLVYTNLEVNKDARVYIPTLLSENNVTSNKSIDYGWKQINNKWYYYKIDGTLRKGWLKILNSWYYMDGNSVMQTGWKIIGNKWYYFNKGGDMKIGWLKLGVDWYYMDGSGTMKIGWVQLGSYWYYFYKNGIMAHDTIIDGIYKINSNGVWVKTA